MNNQLISKLSPHLFWDVPIGNVDIVQNKSFIIHRVLEYGKWSDWLLIRDYFGVDDIVNTAKTFRNLDAKSLSFLSNISNVPLDKFRCYITRQSLPKHSLF